MSHAHPCTDHPCDNCPECQAGRCCGENVVDSTLPVEGSYPDAVLEVGAWDEDIDGIKCHICGQRKENLAAHVRMAHAVTPDEYRAYFGLACGRPLMSVRMRADRAFRAQGRDPEILQQNRPTNEQASFLAFAREARAEVRAKRKEQFNPDFQRRMARRRVAKWNGDPAYRKALRKKLLVARRKRIGDTDRTCPYCGCWFCPMPGAPGVRYGGSAVVSCRSDECRRAAKVAAVRKRWELARAV